MNSAPVGIFDSGIGGLTVARAIYDRLPNESTIYFGDTARVPTFIPSRPRRRGATASRFSAGCSTRGQSGRDRLQHQHRDALEVFSRVAGARHRRDRLGARAAVAAGRGVYRGHRHRRHHREQRLCPGHPPGASRCAVEQRACPLFVPLVEEGWFEHPRRRTHRGRIPGAAEAGGSTCWCSAVPLPVLRPLLQRAMGPECGSSTAAKPPPKRWRRRCGPRAGSAGRRRVFHRFAVSDDEARFSPGGFALYR
jgi:glutamate racemase